MKYQGNILRWQALPAAHVVADHLICTGLEVAVVERAVRQLKYNRVRSVILRELRDDSRVVPRICLDVLSSVGSGVYSR